MWCLFALRCHMKPLGWFAALSISATLGCSTSSQSTTTPSGAGRIELSVFPTSVSYAGGAGVGGAICPFPDISRWGPYVLTIRNTGGTAVTVTSFRLVVRTLAGTLVSDEELVAGLSRDFTGTVAPTLRVPANTSLNSESHYDCERETNGRPDFPGGTAVFTATGTDDGGRAVSAQATLTLLPPPS